MCGRNIVTRTYYHGGTPVETTTSIAKSTRTARQMAEVQRDAQEALTENLAAAQRRSLGLANEGLEFVRLQEDNARAAQEWFAGGVRLLRLQQRNAEFVGGWASDAVEALREQSEHNARTAEAFARTAVKQQEGFRALAQAWSGTYRDLFFSPFSYAQQALRTSQRATERGLEATRHAAQRGLEVAEEAAELTDEVVGRAKEATREAELRAAVFGALKTADYDGLTVEEVSRRIDGLSAEQLEEVREFEKRNKNRESLLERIDRKIRASS
jgi:hypothetical protein